VSNAAITWARSVPRVAPGRAPLTGTQKLVLLLLADHANDAGECWPSIDGLAADACLSDRAVRAAVRDLEAAGLVAAADRKGGRHRTTRYRLITETRNHVPGNEAETRNVVPLIAPKTRKQVPGIAPKRGNLVPERGNVVPERGNDVPPNPKEPSKEPSPSLAGGRARARPRPSPRTEFPEGWSPTPGHRERCERDGLDADRLADAFANHHRAKGTLFKDWDAAFDTWRANEAMWRQARGGGPPRPSPATPNAKPKFLNPFAKIAWEDRQRERAAAAAVWDGTSEEVADQPWAALPAPKPRR
jgi:hypothetical protein